MMGGGCVVALYQLTFFTFKKKIKNYSVLWHALGFNAPCSLLHAFTTTSENSIRRVKIKNYIKN